MMNLSSLPSWIERRIQINANGCWVWIGEIAWNGYGQIRRGSLSTSRIAHRAVWIELRGPIPDGLDLDHLCRNRPCVNPDHLEPVTRSENLRRSPLMGWQRRAQTHCKQGHEFTPENTRRRSDRPGERICKTCMVETTRRWRNRNRSEVTAQ